MRTVIVTIDLETTGLNAESDTIIEIGAVRFEGDQVLDTYRTLVNPERPIPPRVTSITGIKPEDVVNAPRLVEVLPVLKRFVGDAPILGHNIGFDLDFLRHNGLPFSQPSFDTYELASVLLPTASRYNLNALMQEMELSVEGDYHSALTDCKATARLYWALWQRLINNVSVTTLRDIVTAARPLPWLGKLPFEEALRERSHSEASPATTPAVIFAGPAPIRSEASAAVLPETAEPLHWNNALAGLIAETFEQGGAAMIEAPAGIEARRAELAAVVQFAAASRAQVIIAVPNADQQSAVISTELPTIQASLRTHLAVTALKGRDHYLCLRRLETFRRRAPTSIEGLRILAKILVWAESGASGDQDDISLRGTDEYAAWQRFSAADEQCAASRCEAQTNGACPFYRARQAAQTAAITVITHGLLLAEGAADGDSVLPNSPYLLVTEAHRLEETATFTLSERLDLAAFQRQMADLGTLDSGVIGDVAALAKVVLGDKAERWIGRLQTVAATVADASKHGTVLFRTLADVLSAVVNGRDDTPAQARLTADTRELPAFSGARAVWHVLREFTGTLAEVLPRLAESIGGWADKISSDDLDTRQIIADVQASVRAAAQHLTLIHQRLRAAIETPDSNAVLWLEAFPDQSTPTIRRAPLQIAPLAASQVWAGRKAVIMSGSTLQIGGTFDTMRERLGAPQGISGVRELVISSPPEAARETLVFVPEDMPDSSGQEKSSAQRAIERAIIELSSIANGKLLTLFTGYSQMRQTAQAVLPRLTLGQIALFDQSDGTSQQALLSGFSSAEKAVLFGTKHFWYEIDLPAEALAVLIITRLPFAPINDPVIATRGELHSDTFADYSLPEAIARFRQGFDRLARVRSGQRAVVAVLDKRLVSKGYGQNFLDNLPPVTIKRGLLSELSGTAKAWLAHEPITALRR